MSRRRLHVFIGAGLVLLGTVLAARAAVIPIKAWVGQVLLESAWSESLESNDAAKPWSWSDFTPLARLTVPKLDITAIVLDQSSGAAMAWGPGHVAGTAQPGGPGLSAVAGHRDTHLRFIADLAPGDDVSLQARDGTTTTYRITGAMVVDSRSWRFPADFTGTARLALATCWPLDAKAEGPMRLVVFGEESQPAS